MTLMLLCNRQTDEQTHASIFHPHWDGVAQVKAITTLYAYCTLSYYTVPHYIIKGVLIVMAYLCNHRSRAAGESEH